MMAALISAHVHAITGEKYQVASSGCCTETIMAINRRTDALESLICQHEIEIWHRWKENSTYTTALEDNDKLATITK